MPRLDLDPLKPTERGILRGGPLKLVEPLQLQSEKAKVGGNKKNGRNRLLPEFTRGLAWFLLHRVHRRFGSRSPKPNATVVVHLWATLCAYPQFNARDRKPTNRQKLTRIIRQRHA